LTTKKKLSKKKKDEENGKIKIDEFQPKRSRFVDLVNFDL